MRAAQGDPLAARALLEHAVALDPEATEARAALGLALVSLDLGDEASRHLEAALRAAPERAEIQNNLGSAYGLMGKDEQAVAAWRSALRLQPGLAEACLNLGDHYVGRGDYSAALSVFQEGARHNPEHKAFLERLLYAKQHLCDWDGLEPLSARRLRLLEERPDEASAPFGLLFLQSTAAQQLACASALARSLEKRARRVGHSRLSPKAVARPRIRIGYLSADFREHVMAYILAELFELHDRRAFELFGYSFGADDGSAMRRRVEVAMEHFVDIRALSDRAAAERIREDGIDVLVDLNGYTHGARSAILDQRPAPVQVNFLGYPGTMGGSLMDYIVVDHFIFREGDAAHYAEQPVFMPACYAPNDRRRDARPTPSRAELGLPQDGFVFCCFNQSAKITPAIFDVWMRILGAQPGSVLWLLEGSAASSANLRREALRRGVAAERIVFAPRAAIDTYLGRIPAADLFLDTAPYNAHTTAADALWAGVPVLTCPGGTFASRVAGSMSVAAGMNELVVPSWPEYERLALNFARRPQDLRAFRHRLAAARTSAPLFDMPAFSRSLEAAYRRMRDRAVAGLPPAPIDLPKFVSG